MTDRKELPAVRIIVGCALSAYVAGEHLEYSKAPAKQYLSVGSITTTSSATSFGFNPVTFAAVEPPPPVIPPRDRQQQG